MSWKDERRAAREEKFWSTPAPKKLKPEDLGKVTRPPDRLRHLLSPNSRRMREEMEKKRCLPSIHIQPLPE